MPITYKTTYVFFYSQNKDKADVCNIMDASSKAPWSMLWQADLSLRKIIAHHRQNFFLQNLNLRGGENHHLPEKYISWLKMLKQMLESRKKIKLAPATREKCLRSFGSSFIYLQVAHALWALCSMLEQLSQRTAVFIAVCTARQQNWGVSRLLWGHGGGGG